MRGLRNGHYKKRHLHIPNHIGAVTASHRRSDARQQSVTSAVVIVKVWEAPVHVDLEDKMIRSFDPKQLFLVVAW